MVFLAFFHRIITPRVLLITMIYDSLTKVQSDAAQLWQHAVKWRLLLLVLLLGTTFVRVGNTLSRFNFEPIGIVQLLLLFICKLFYAKMSVGVWISSMTLSTWCMETVAAVVPTAAANASTSAPSASSRAACVFIISSAAIACARSLPTTTRIDTTSNGGSVGSDAGCDACG